jgi:formylglycine-generating enzyme
MGSKKGHLVSFLAALVFSVCNWTGAAAAGHVQVGTFAIDRTEVTIAAFRAFKAATGLVTEAERQGGGFEWGAGWERRPGWVVDQPFGRPPESLEEPAVHVTWAEAQRFCNWRGGRLPAKSEWLQAAYTESRARPEDGFVHGRTYAYPVGDKPEGMNTTGADPWPLHAPVASTHRGVNGLYDMGGNVWEWLADRRNGEALTAGGSWWYDAKMTKAGGLQYKPADFYAVYVGFRCVYDNR